MMNRQPLVFSALIPTLSATLSALLLGGCQLGTIAQDEIKRVFAASETISIPQGGASPSPSPTSSPAPNCFREAFQQPEEQISRSVDVLFVADTSGSMADNRIKVAEGLHAFVGQFPANVDYRIGMMLAHSSQSSLSGRLWTLPNQDRNPVNGYPYVLDSAQMTQHTIQTRLRTMMETARDQNEQGEMMQYSLLQGLTSARLAESRALGFFRPNAALAVVFISDENDLCAIYPADAGDLTANPGAGQWSGMTGSESSIRNRDCSGGIRAAEVINAVRTLQQDRPFIFGAIVNNTNPLMLRSGNDGYGWGMMQVIEESRGLSLNIEDGNYITGLGQLGQLVTRKLELILSRRLEHSPVDPASIDVLVDGVRKDANFIASTNEVHFTDAGGARSTVEINYCLQQGWGGGGGELLPGLGI